MTNLELSLEEEWGSFLRSVLVVYWYNSLAVLE